MPAVGPACFAGWKQMHCVCLLQAAMRQQVSCVEDVAALSSACTITVVAAQAVGRATWEA